MTIEKAALDTLETEHELILQVLDALDSFCSAASGGQDVDREDLGRFVEFVRQFVDGAHHSKEEKVLFPAMVDAGFPGVGEPGPISVMMTEHDVGRETVAQLAAIASAGEWPADAAATISSAGHRFSELLRGHIHKENHVLYPMARGRLTPDQMQGVDERCAQLDADAADKTSKLSALGQSLVDRYR